jgi:hypothetical protein
MFGSTFDPSLDAATNAINSHVTSTRSLFSKLVTTPLLPTTHNTISRTEDDSVATLAYLASSVATTAARVARLETFQTSLENKSLQLAHQQLASTHLIHGGTLHSPFFASSSQQQEKQFQRRQEEMLAQILKPMNNSLDQHERVLTDVIAIVNQMAANLEDSRERNLASEKNQKRKSSNNAAGTSSSPQSAHSVKFADQQTGNNITNVLLSPMTNKFSEGNTNNNNTTLHHDDEDDEKEEHSTTTSTQRNPGETTTTSSSSTSTFQFSPLNHENRINPSAAASTRAGSHIMSEASPYSRAYRALVASLELGK